MKKYLLVALVALSCQDAGKLPLNVSGERLVITFSPSAMQQLGTAQNPLPINFNTTTSYSVDVQMLRPDGSVDASFNSFVRLSAQPGEVYTVNGGQDGRNVQLTAGVAKNVQVTIIGAYGPTRIWGEDLGYVPAPLNRATPPACSNGKDDNNNDRIDYPADPGCYAPNDDSEDKGTGATGVSDTIYYAAPRVADLRGAFIYGGTRTPFSYDQVNIATGFDSQSNPPSFAYDVVVTGLASDGFFFTDLQDMLDGTGKNIDPQQGVGFGSLFAYTFTAPLNIGVCDRIRLIQGTTSDFYGYTELNFPTWATEIWNPNARPCLVPEPFVLSLSDWANAPLLFQHESGLVRIQTGSGLTLHVGAHFGPGHPDMTHGYLPYCDATGCYTNCDLTNIGKVDFNNPNDNACATACTADAECTEYASYASQGGFSIVVSDGTLSVKMQGSAQAAPAFDPVASKGVFIGAFTGLLRYFSGGSQFTIQARCNDDVIANPMGTALSSSSACITRNGHSNEQL